MSTTSEVRSSRAPNLYECDYAHGRRAHRHRCFCCRRIINTGERVLMWKASGKTTRAMHVACGDVGTGLGITHRQLAQLHVDEYARKLGFTIPNAEPSLRGETFYSSAGVIGSFA